jgi:hypothetical protein
MAQWQANALKKQSYFNRRQGLGMPCRALSSRDNAIPKSVRKFLGLSLVVASCR